MTKNNTQKNLTTKQVVEIHGFLSEVINIIDSQNHKYKTGWTDKRVSEKFKTSPYQISRVRRENFGELRATPTSTTASQLEARTTELEKKVSDLISFVEQNFQPEYEAVKS